ncbi:LOG family protein [Gloeocapsa sp. PCC 73106]|uniref:LOG family protein n=1 Tax=Gloeocapsa sp. PCC 73106 TaxID=102232 RepID=UPI0002AC2E56|nr:LOG family protein [Gloeocapsa sp. PCC 73106]ELR98003.1 putative Rossmann fold nucleotide-binding protein [Gloeocapsa sp. PCC 73106]
MALSHPENNLQSSLTKELIELTEQLSTRKHGKWIQRALSVLLRIAGEEVDRLDWKILATSLEDLENGFQIFYQYRHIRKITIFGSARISPETREYQLAVEFARRITELGFMVLTGGGGGIMQAGNQGAGREQSFGLNINLPFEQEANPYIVNDPKLINFKYFFTRKLFFLRESDAIALFPGGFGTQDEAFETLTLCQTGKYGPVPLVLVDEPGGNYWSLWHKYICNLVDRGLVSLQDTSLYTITDSIDEACQIVCNFYRMYHSSRYVNNLFVMRLNGELTEQHLEQLNQEFADILVKGRIEKSDALPEEQKDETTNLPRIVFYFNQKDLGRLYQMINKINRWYQEIETNPNQGPEWK